MKYLLAIAILLACEQSTAQADGPPQPACVFEREPVAIFCTGQYTNHCYVCYKSNGETQCWLFDGRERCAR